MAKRPNKIKHIWHSNSPHSGSGYAVETRDLLFRFIKDGYDFDAIGFWGIESYPIIMHGEDLIDDRFKDVKLKVYPKMGEPYGGDALISHSKDAGAKVAFVMVDLFAIPEKFFAELNQNNIKLIPYLPIDQEPINSVILNNLKYAYKIITFSNFGQEALEKEGYASHMIHEGIDTEIFKPKDKTKMRKKYGLPEDKFIFGMVAANKENPPRKAFQEVLEAFARFEKIHPDSALFFHNQQVSPGGFPITDYARYLGINKKIYLMNPYKATFSSNSNTISDLINCFDVYLNPSMTEGFGMGMVESQSCGVLPIGNRCHSMPELVVEGKTGLICETGKPLWRSLQGYVYPPDVESLTGKMLESFELVKNPKTAKACRKNVVDNFNIDTLVEKQWKPFLNEIQEELAES